MMPLKTTTGVLIGSLLLIGTIDPAAAGTIRYRERSSGSFHNTAIDTNGDTIPATLSLLTGKTSAGPMTGETLGEFRLFNPNTDTPSGECAVGTLEFPFVNGIGVNRFQDGSILVLAPQFSVLCLDPLTGTGIFVNRGVFQSRGSTKRFQGVSGSWETHGTVTGLVFTPTGEGVMGTVNFELNGNLILP